MGGRPPYPEPGHGTVNKLLLMAVQSCHGTADHDHVGAFRLLSRQNSLGSFIAHSGALGSSVRRCLLVPAGNHADELESPLQ